MKKICLLIGFIIASYAITAQIDTPRVHIGIRGGADFTTCWIPRAVPNPISIFGNETDYAFKTGFHAGFVADIRLTDHWSLQPGLFYSMQRTQNHAWFGKSINDTTVTTEATEMYKTHYLKVPVMVHYNISTAARHLVVGAGVYVSCALAGNACLDETEKYSTGEQILYTGEFDPYKTGNKYLYKQFYGDDYTAKELYYQDNFFHRFNFGLSLEVGYQISKFYLGLQADLDLLNSGKTEFFGTDFKQRFFNIQATIGYNLN